MASAVKTEVSSPAPAKLNHTKLNDNITTEVSSLHTLENCF